MSIGKNRLSSLIYYFETFQQQGTTEVLEVLEVLEAPEVQETSYPSPSKSQPSLDSSLPYELDDDDIIRDLSPVLQSSEVTLPAQISKKSSSSFFDRPRSMTLSASKPPLARVSNGRSWKAEVLMTTPKKKPRRSSVKNDPINLTNSRRMFAAREILSTEQSYVEQLKVLIKTFKRPFEEKKIIDKLASNTIFSNVESILKFHQTLLHKLEKRMKKWKERDPNTQLLGKMFNRLLPFLKIYTAYCSNYENALQTVFKYQSSSEEFNAFIEHRVKSKQCQGLDFIDFLIMPVQRIPRYRLLLENLLKFTDACHPDFNELTISLEKVTGAAELINENISHMQKFQKVNEIREHVNGIEKILGTGQLISPDRSFVSEHRLIIQLEHPCYCLCYIFSDGLLIVYEGAEYKETGKYTALAYIPLHILFFGERTKECKIPGKRSARWENQDLKGSKNKNKVSASWWFRIASPDRSYWFQAQTETAEGIFKNSIQKCIDKLLVICPNKIAERECYKESLFEIRRDHEKPAGTNKTGKMKVLSGLQQVKHFLSPVSHPRRDRSKTLSLNLSASNKENLDVLDNFLIDSNPVPPVARKARKKKHFVRRQKNKL
eukprot:TRINITY_DN5072_c0_g1_i1.p1 TRINITY_DN5072_c0_g1~~TRINITY_DN5072_c0_g1_i1.p1  ORF type:complete len:634 (+),score=106.91 TRINITY_DN5072_c0_g1_i1:91-1902(+)